MSSEASPRTCLSFTHSLHQVKSGVTVSDLFSGLMLNNTTFHRIYYLILFQFLVQFLFIQLLSDKIIFLKFMMLFIFFCYTNSLPVHFVYLIYRRCLIVNLSVFFPICQLLRSYGQIALVHLIIQLCLLLT